MTKRFKLLLLILLITMTSTISCSTYYAHTTYEQRIDADLSYYVDYVTQLAPEFSKVDSITFYYKEPSSKNENYTVGYCSFSLVHWKSYVKINKHWWKTASDKERITLMAHELKHCSCPTNWFHNNKEDEIKCRINYMSSSIPNVLCIRLYYNDYVEQIKRGCNDR